jgi:hypothetical protein
MYKTGSKIKVWHGNATKTSGGKYRDDMMQLPDGRIVYTAQHKAGINRMKKDPKHPFHFFGGGKATKKGEIELAPEKGTKAHKEAMKKYKAALKKKNK